MITEISALDYIDDDIIRIPFFKNGKPLDCSSSAFSYSINSADNSFMPMCCLSLRKHGSMRFRWNESSPTRDAFFATHTKSKVVSVELFHSQIVYTVSSGDELLPNSEAFSVDRIFATTGTSGKQGDGIITCNKNLAPAVTVADCVPIYLFDPVKGVFGVLHSGWKGTGIATVAIHKMKTDFGCQPSDILALIGPHIHSCCYTVDDTRAEYFRRNYTPDCVERVKNQSTEYSNRLSLVKANIALLQKSGVENITHCSDCTCCSNEFGSFRRETRDLPENMSIDEKSRHFTVMAAFICWK